MGAEGRYGVAARECVEGGSIRSVEESRPKPLILVIFVEGVSVANVLNKTNIRE